MGDIPVPRWEVDLGFDPVHVVEMDESSSSAGCPRSFLVDGTERTFGRVLLKHVVEFPIGGRPARLTMRFARPSFRVWFRRVLWDLGDASGPNALRWACYELAVDGQSRGTWVVTVVGGQARDWTYVEPGGALPAARASADWERSVRTAPRPAPRPVPSEEERAMFEDVRRAGRREIASFVAAAAIGALTFGAGVALMSSPGAAGSGTSETQILVLGLLLAVGIVIGLITTGQAGYAGTVAGYAGACLAVVVQQAVTLGLSSKPSEDIYWLGILTVVVAIPLAIIIAGVFIGRRLRGPLAGLFTGRGGPAASGMRRP